MNAHVKPLKFCKDCKHSSIGDPEYARCNAPQRVIGVNLVTGSPKFAISFCENARVSDTFCGPDAKWFEPRI